MNIDIVRKITNLPIKKIHPVVSQVLGEDAVSFGDLLVQKIGRSGGTATIKR